MSDKPKSTWFSHVIKDKTDLFAAFKAKAVSMAEPNHKYEDSVFLRFFLARNYDPEKATLMWGNFINWKKENNVGEPFDYPEVNEVKQYFPHAFFRTDKEGRPIYIERLGQLQYNNLMNVTTRDRFVRYYMNNCERMATDIFPSCSEAANTGIYQRLFIMDMAGMGWRTATPGALELTRILLGTGNAYYPENMSELYIVNTPTVFYGLWKIIQMWVDDKTKKKVHILGSNFKDKLLNRIDEENLPDFLGGKATIEEYGECLTKEQGPWIKTKQNNQTRDQDITTQESNEENEIDYFYATI